MRPGVLLATSLAVLLALPPAAAAVAADPAAEQDLEVDVVPEDVLGIEVENVTFGAVLPGAAVEQSFATQVFNTTSAGWQVSVEAQEFTASAELCPGGPVDAPWCLDRDDRAATIPLTQLRVRGGSVDGVVTAEEGSLDVQPLVVMRGGFDPGRFWFGFEDDPPRVRLDVPAETAYGSYRTTLTYTITSDGGDTP
jgi:hypothetical protein